jgi:hypothetical protein
MTMNDRLSDEELAKVRKRRLDMQKLQEIEGNPLTADEIAMFEMFDRERWSHERRRAYIQALFRSKAGRDAAE